MTPDDLECVGPCPVDQATCERDGTCPALEALNAWRAQPRHPITGRFLAFDCETDCREHCAGLCGAW